MKVIVYEWKEQFEVFSDNIGAQTWTTPATSLRRKKHIELLYFSAQSCFEDITIIFKNAASPINREEIFTKPLDHVKLNRSAK